MSIIKDIYHALVPAGIRLNLYNAKTKIHDEKIKGKILSYYTMHPSDDAEINEALEYLRHNPITVFPYSFYPSYFQKNIEVKIDPSNNFPYVIHGKNKLYLKKIGMPTE